METIQTVKFDILKIVSTLDIPAGKKLCRIINKKGVISLGAMIPEISFNDIEEIIKEDSRLQEYIAIVFKAVQDKIVRNELATNSLGNNEVALENISVSWVAKATTNLVENEKKERVSSRLTKDLIGLWFDTEIAEHIVKALKEKDFSTKMMNDTLKAFKGCFQLLAGDSAISTKVKDSLIKVMSLLPGHYDSVIGNKVLAKLMKEEEDVTDLLDLF